MGNKMYTPRMMIDRMIVAEPYRVVVGITGEVGSEENPYREQVIRIGDELAPSIEAGPRF